MGEHERQVAIAEARHRLTVAVVQAKRDLGLSDAEALLVVNDLALWLARVLVQKERPDVREALKELVRLTSDVCRDSYGPEVEAAYEAAEKALGR